MPRRKISSIGQVSRRSLAISRARSNESLEDRHRRLTQNRERNADARSRETEERRSERLENDRANHALSRSTESLERTQTRQSFDRERHQEARAEESAEANGTRRRVDRERHQEARSEESVEEADIRRRVDRERHQEARSEESVEEADIRRRVDRERHQEARSEESVEATDTRRMVDREQHQEARAEESVNATVVRRVADCNRRRSARNQTSIAMDMIMQGFSYGPDIPYQNQEAVQIGEMNILCQHCGAKRYRMESPGICCNNGKVNLPLMRQPPQILLDLMSGSNEESKHFLKNIRRYNNCFRMTSFGASAIIREGNFMPTFKIQGQVYHRAGSLLPSEDNQHQFLQIYFMGDEDVELDLRHEIVPGTRRDLVLKLQRFFHLHNGLVQVFKTTLEQMPTDNHKVVIKADKTPANHHQGTFNAPTVNEAAVIIFGPFEKRDIVLQKRSTEFQRISETHRCYDALQYPIILWDGQDSYHFNLKLINPVTNLPVSKSMSAMQFYSHRLMIRSDENHLLNCRELLNQFLTDMYAKIESERLAFLRANQNKLRVDEYIHLRDALSSDGNANDVGQMVILPSTFIGSPRHMNEYAQDAMTYVARYGRPDLFITFTCNPNWEDITKELSPGQLPQDRHDIVARVFRQKLIMLIDLITKSQLFGEVRCHMLSIEWQKRGLPHSHILIWLKNKILPTQIDSIITAEIPDPEIDPDLHGIIMKTMIHGPCGAINPQAPCMNDNRCTKKYPKPFLSETISGVDGYPQYRRRNPEEGGQTAKIRVKGIEVEIDNTFVVPYNPVLSKAFNAHINVEVCNNVKSIKYICKYVNKGCDKAVFGVARETGVDTYDEISNYQSGRYISSDEAVWRIFGFPIHERHPAVVHLSVHLEGGQRVYFNEQNAQERVASPPDTTLTAFFKLCQQDSLAQKLFYHQIPEYFSWNNSSKKFSRRIQGLIVEVEDLRVKKADTLGRVYTVHPNNAECFYLRMLLHVVKGPKSFCDLKTVGTHVCQTFREACQRLGLLEEDNHWEAALEEAALRKSPDCMRSLFAIILSSCHPSNPKDLWEKFKEPLTEDILFRYRQQNPDLHIEYSADIFNESLIRIQRICVSMCNKNLEQLGLDNPEGDEEVPMERALLRERNYNTSVLDSFVESRRALLNFEQMQAFDSVMDTISTGSGKILFLDAPGGTGKTFLLNLILAAVRKDQGIALAVASSGIASTLLEGGRTAHSTLKIPLDIASKDNPMCNISKSTSEGRVLKECKLIVWDECTMAHRNSLEALNNTLKDIKSKDEVMGGIVLLLAGDFRQILPVVKSATPAEEIDSTLKTSSLWLEVSTLKLRTNMRVHLLGDSEAQDFSETLLNVGDGVSNIPGTYNHLLPSSLCQRVSTPKELISKVYPNFHDNFWNNQWLQERAILAPKNDYVSQINCDILNMVTSDCKTYLSIDSVIDTNQAILYATEFLNTIELAGFPSHKLILKVGAPIMMLRNLNPPLLCNGTRLRVTKLLQNIIEATILIGKFAGERVLIPRIPLISSEQDFEFRRLQFPVKVCFGMTINKSQGQSLKVVGVDLSNPCFSHGQFYVAASRVGSPKNLYILSPTDTTKNVVYESVL